MDEFVILIRKNGRAVPWFQAKEGGLCIDGGPESDGGEVRIIHLNSFA